MIPTLLIVAAVLLLGLAARGGIRMRPPARPLSPRAPAAPPRVRRPVRADVPHTLYRYDWLPEVATAARIPADCYYGISNEEAARHARHGRDPADDWWYRQSTQTMHIVAVLPNRAAAKLAERNIVRSRSLAGAHLANNHHNVRRPARAQYR